MDLEDLTSPESSIDSETLFRGLNATLICGVRTILEKHTRENESPPDCWQRNRKQSDGDAIPLPTALFLLDVVVLITRRALLPSRHFGNRSDCRERCFHVVFVIGAVLRSDLVISVEAS
jgi:hypothetical protein